MSSRMEIGDLMPDGSIYLGLYRGREWYVTAHGTEYSDGRSLTMNFNDAVSLAKNLHQHGHTDWQLPDQGMIERMYKNRNQGAFKGTYHTTPVPFMEVHKHQENDSWLWSSHPDANFDHLAWRRSFTDGEITGDWTSKIYKLSVRCVRSEPAVDWALAEARQKKLKSMIPGKKLLKKTSSQPR